MIDPALKVSVGPTQPSPDGRTSGFVLFWGGIGKGHDRSKRSFLVEPTHSVATNRCMVVSGIEDATWAYDRALLEVSGNRPFWLLQDYQL